jgi:hypothetical protein
MTSFNKVVVYVSPFFIYYSLAFAFGKCYEWIFDAESVWQSLWNKIIDVLGEDREAFSVWILNSYAYTLYWLFGSLILILELAKTPKGLNVFRIQTGKSSERIKDVVKVRGCG